MTDVVITAAKRTPVGAFLGSFAAVPGHELGRTAISAALEQAGVAPEEVSEVILGQVLTAAQGQNPARQASMAAGVPKEVPAWGLNQVCGSGLRAVAVAAQSIIAGDAEVVVAGGQESMSLSAHAQNLRTATKMGGLELVDTMIRDGLTDVFNGYHMESRPRTSPSNIRSRATTRTRSPAHRRTRRRVPAATGASRPRSRRSRSRAARARPSSNATNSSATGSRSRAWLGFDRRSARTGR
jgi:hypothetical protein